MQLDNFYEIFQAKGKIRNYLKEKCYSEHYQQLSFKYFVISFSIPKLSSKEAQVQTTIIVPRSENQATATASAAAGTDLA